MASGPITSWQTEGEKMDWFIIGKGVQQGFILLPCCLTYMQSTSCELPGWKNHKLEQDCQEKYQQPQICR